MSEPDHLLDPPARRPPPGHDAPSVDDAPSGDDARSTLMEQVFNALPDGVVMLDRQWRFSFANGRAYEIVGGVEMVGHNIFELFPGNRDEPYASTYRAAMEQRVAGAFEAFYGEPLNIWFKIQATPFEGGIIVFFSDITERKEAERRESEAAGRALRATESEREIAERLTQSLEVTSDAVTMLDREWRYTYLNSNARRLIDPAGRLLGKVIWEEFPQLERSPVAATYRQSMDHGLPASCDRFWSASLRRWLSARCEPTANGIIVFLRDVSEEKEHTELVETQAGLLAAVQEVARLATWEIDLTSGRIHYGSGSFEVLGHPLSAIPTLAALDRILLPVHSEPLRLALERAVTTGEIVALEFAVTAADGSILWVESRGQLVPGTAGKPRLRGMTLDITARKHSEQELVTSEARYRVLADLNPQAIWMGDPQGNITYANLGFLAYIGLEPEDLKDGGWLRAFAPEDRDRVVEVWTRSVTTGVDYDIEAHLRHAETGKQRWWHLRAAPIRGASGAILNWLGVGSDVHDARTYAETLRAEQIETERKRAELETIYRTTPIGLALLDPVDFRFLNLNDQEAEMLGRPKELLLGRPITEVAASDKLPGLLDMMRSVAAGHVVKDRLLEGELPSTPGEVRAWRVNYSPLFNEDGTVRAISTASIEITNQKKAEAALIQSEKLAAVGRLASSISHEINNPLEAITNLLYLMGMEENLSPEMHGYVHMAQSELSRVSQIATQTLRFHRQAVAPTHVSAEELVGAVIRLYTGRLANSGITVDARYNTSAPILCFENDIRQVLNNLIANAIDAMRTGGRLIIRAHGAAAGVRITVADTGHGMSAAVRARVFEPFFTTKDLNGTGLGLWISAGIVERHRGRLRLRSSDRPAHHGTVFTLFLPREDTPQPTVN